MAFLTLQQRVAADPNHSVWVAASAGTGKTKVLIDRILRLLLQGTRPERILCLTYTKAAAAEMADRIHAELAHWAVCDAPALHGRLEILSGEAPTAKQSQRARQLFAQVTDAPEGIRMLTIHSLCQSLLRRFSLEAGVSPHFRVMEEREARLLIEQAQQQLFLAHREGEDAAELAAAIARLAEKISEPVFNDLLQEIIAHRAEFQRLLTPPLGVVQTEQAIARAAGLDAITDEADLLNKNFNYSEQDIDNLRSILPYILEGTGKGDQTTAQALTAWLDALPEIMQAAAQAWIQACLTQKHEPRKAMVTKPVLKRCPQAEAILQAEQQRCYAYQQQWLALQTVRYSQDVLTLGEALLALYGALKQRRGLLDYEDLIAHSAQLLAQPDIAPWVLYKLDGGIDHLLVDEAQDTSPVQWRLIDALAGDFFSGESAEKTERTLFVVGDEKQSIYSFQGAQPRAFAEMKQHFAQAIQAAQKGYQPVSLSLSFRSTLAVLQLVDAVFATPPQREGVLFSEESVSHQAHRDAPGRVELWPPVTPPEQPEREAWTIPEQGQAFRPPEQILAERIADTIQGWLREKALLPARARPIRAGDILVLVRRRHRFFDYLISALKQRDIPLAGADRLKLGEHIAVQDMLALAQFLLLPEDDLTLACLLKSPLFGIGEEQLFTLCHERSGTLWQSLRQRKEAPFTAIVQTLESLLAEVDYLSPYALFSRVLDVEGGRRRFRARMGREVDDPLDELLNVTLQYEILHIPSLQGFVHWFGQVETEIKRDMEQAEDKVRIMTVHGAKGLQAPIVLLPDTAAIPRSSDSLLWQEDSFLWAHDAEQECLAVTAAKERRKQEELQEYKRLLYVALTRAADELHVMGWQGEKDLPEACWYRQVEQAMRQCGEEMPDGRWVLKDKGYDDVAAAAADSAEIKEHPQPLPTWLAKVAADEPVPPRPLMPSRPDTEAPAADSPLVKKALLQRGSAVHHLLEVLPDIPKRQWVQAAEVLLRRQWPEATHEEKEQVIGEVTKVLEHPEFAPVFGEGSQAEVPVTATVIQDGAPRILSGRIDRLVVLPNKILILDYKTTQQVPVSSEQIPAHFRQQLAGYAEVMRKLYPNRTVQTAILWTAAPVLMPVSLLSAQAA